MIVENVKIYDLEESLIASGYPMRTKLQNDGIINEKDLSIYVGSFRIITSFVL